MKKITDADRIEWLIKNNPTIYLGHEVYPKWGDARFNRRAIDAAMRRGERSDQAKDKGR